VHPGASLTTDVPYTPGFYREMAPEHLAFAAIAAGYSPGAAQRPKRLLELGFGRGFGLALLAAANPDVAFEGQDADADNVAHAKRMVDVARLGNITVTHTSFEDAVARNGRPDVDVVTMHGVFSWMSKAARAAALAIVSKRLRPGGLFYVSYNCMPGWAPKQPIRGLALAVKQRVAADALEQMKIALTMLSGLRQGNATYFAASASAARHFDEMLGMDPRYLVHEYLAEHWEPMYFFQAASEMAAAGLGYAGSATLTENLDQCSVPKDVLPLLAQMTDPVLRETLRDFGANKQFRRDVYAHDGTPLATEERRRAWGGLRFVLAVARQRVTFKFLGPLTELNGNPLLYAPLIDRLDRSGATFEELLNVSGLGESRVGLLMECLTLLVHSGQVFALSGSDADIEPAKRFNRAVIACAREGTVFENLAAPLLRSGVPVSDFGLLALSALLEGKGHNAEAAGKHGLTILNALGRRPLKDLQPIERDNDAIDFLAEYMQPILEEAVPVWRGLGAI
jgi:SAM-dependent methyltransferase